MARDLRGREKTPTPQCTMAPPDRSEPSTAMFSLTLGGLEKCLFYQKSVPEAEEIDDLLG